MSFQWVSFIHLHGYWLRRIRLILKKFEEMEVTNCVYFGKSWGFTLICSEVTQCVKISKQIWFDFAAQPIRQNILLVREVYILQDSTGMIFVL
jgi:hypothetical protein